MKFEITWTQGELADAIRDSGVIQHIAKDLVMKKIGHNKNGGVYQGVFYVVMDKQAAEIVEESESATRTIKLLEE